MKRIPIHCSLQRFLDDYETDFAGLVTIIDQGDFIVEGQVRFIFGIGGWYPDYARQLYNESFSNT